MNFTPVQKRSLFGTPNCNKILRPSINSSHIKSLQKSLVVHRRDENPYTPTQEDLKIKQQTATVIKQLSMSFLFAICDNFQETMQQEMENIVSKILMLECKIAECQKKFNAVQLQLLHKGSKEMGTLVEENILLHQLNKGIEVRMQQLKQKYQVSYSIVKNEWMTNLVQQFRSELNQFQVMKKQCESCQKGIKERLKRQVDKLQSLCRKEERPKNTKNMDVECSRDKDYDKLGVIKDTLKSTVQMLYNCQAKQLSSFELTKWKQTILENVDLKFEVMEIRQKSKYWQGLSHRLQMPPNSGSA